MSNDPERSPTPDVSLHESGLKSTMPRLRVLEHLRSAPQRHHGADDIAHALHRSGNAVPLATIYRVLGQLERAGIVRRSRLHGGKAIYELDDTGHHDHIVCTRCGRMVEFNDAEIEQRQARIAAERGFELVAHDMALFGDCLDAGCERRPRG